MAGYNFTAVKLATTKLKREGKICYLHTGSIKERVWYIESLEKTDTIPVEEIPNESTPFDEKNEIDLEQGSRQSGKR